MKHGGEITTVLNYKTCTHFIVPSTVLKDWFLQSIIVSILYFSIKLLNIYWTLNTDTELQVINITEYKLTPTITFDEMIVYAPANAFTNNIMKKVIQTIGISNEALKSINSEHELNQYINETNSAIIAILFNISSSEIPKQLYYSIKADTNIFKYPHSQELAWEYFTKGFICLQENINKAFTEMVSNASYPFKISFQQLQFPTVYTSSLPISTSVINTLVDIVFMNHFIVPLIYRRMCENIDQSSGSESWISIKSLILYSTITTLIINFLTAFTTLIFMQFSNLLLVATWFAFLVLYQLAGMTFNYMICALLKRKIYDYDITTTLLLVGRILILLLSPAPENTTEISITKMFSFIIPDTAATYGNSLILHIKLHGVLYVLIVLTLDIILYTTISLLINFLHKKYGIQSGTDGGFKIVQLFKTINHWICQIILLLASLIILCLILSHGLRKVSNTVEINVNLSLNIFGHTDVVSAGLYSQSGILSNTEMWYEQQVKNQNGIYHKIAIVNSITEVPRDYDIHIGAEFTESNDGKKVAAIFSNKDTHSAPISLDSVSNAILKAMAGEAYGISTVFELLEPVNATLQQDQSNAILKVMPGEAYDISTVFESLEPVNATLQQDQSIPDFEYVGRSGLAVAIVIITFMGMMVIWQTNTFRHLFTSIEYLVIIVVIWLCIYLTVDIHTVEPFVFLGGINMFLFAHCFTFFESSQPRFNYYINMCLIAGIVGTVWIQNFGINGKAWKIVLYFIPPVMFCDTVSQLLQKVAYNNYYGDIKYYNTEDIMMEIIVAVIYLIVNAVIKYSPKNPYLSIIDGNKTPLSNDSQVDQQTNQETELL